MVTADRRGFIKGLLTSIAATPIAVWAIKSARQWMPSWVYKPMLNSGAWDSAHATYEEAKAASDKLAGQVIAGIKRMPPPKQSKTLEEFEEIIAKVRRQSLGR